MCNTERHVSGLKKAYRFVAYHLRLIGYMAARRATDCLEHISVQAGLPDSTLARGTHGQDEGRFGGLVRRTGERIVIMQHGLNDSRTCTLPVLGVARIASGRVRFAVLRAHHTLHGRRGVSRGCTGPFLVVPSPLRRNHVHSGAFFPASPRLVTILLLSTLHRSE